MATRPPVDCPLCHSVPACDQRLVGHLEANHSKRELAKFVASETIAMETGEISE